MPTPARRIDTDQPQHSATVLLTDGDALAVRSATGEHRCRRAASCLLAPEPGDRVLVALVEGERWVLAVLERREGAGAARVEVRGDLELRAPNGAVTVAAGEGVTLVTPRGATVAAGSLRVDAGVTALALGEVAAAASRIEAEVGRLRARYGVVDAVAERVSERVKRAYRWVEEFEQLRARRLDWEAKETLQVHAGDALVTSEGLVKVDGAQIHLG